jgi:hypothetical protein
MAEAGGDVAAVGAEVRIGRRQEGMRHQGIQREAGGLPEVFVGCGVAVRRGAYLAAGGYDAAFGYYAEEYDLAAKFLLMGMRVTLDRRFVVEHRKVSVGRDMGLILGRLVRNNGWVMGRYAPERRRIGEVSRVVGRYGEIARKEGVEAGYGAGLAELVRTLGGQKRSAMCGEMWDRFTGKAAARTALVRAWRRTGFQTAAVVEEGKNAHVVREVLREMGVREVGAGQGPGAVVIGTMSPGPMLDAWERWAGAAVAPWEELVGAPAARVNAA